MSDNSPKGIFITGTDTGVGKSLIAAALTKVLKDCGINVGVMKPVETGVENPAQLGPDAQLLKWAASTDLPDDQISPYRMRTPAAPSVAASQEKVRIDYNDLVQQGNRLIEEHDFTIIEGAGGLMVPLAGGFLMADYARALNLPLLVVSRPNLGTINHTLLTLFSARNLELQIAGYMINNMPSEPDEAEKTVANTLATMSMDELLGVIDQVEGDDYSKVKQIAAQICQLNTRPLLAKYLPINFSRAYPASIPNDGLSAELREQLLQTAARTMKGPEEKIFNLDKTS